MADFVNEIGHLFFCPLLGTNPIRNNFLQYQYLTSFVAYQMVATFSL